ncbi:alanine racemase [Rhodococcoides trifolii]|uniref:Alanine racemase n=1 Tax=Rhodococcoides trifolii TaxID=908250 RepID=A0A917LCC6_9NOCA|nr:alanine racemase [Rhodococcus trifolii]GGG13958.1 alanine racemase [Rhodococcus trifolii]
MDLAQTTRRPQAEAQIDLNAIAHNARILVDAAAGAAVMAVVKADGYNHGAVEVAQAALAAGVSELGVTTVGEALALRRAGIVAPILAWLHSVDTDYDAAIGADVELGISSHTHLEAIVDAARRVGAAATVSVKIDTGLNRNGVGPADLDSLYAALAAAVADGSVTVRALFSHLACADVPDHPVNDAQKARFDDAVERARRAGLEPTVLHLANSAAALTRPDMHYDMVRPGIALYGLSPAPELGTFGLRPAMTLKARVALVKSVAAGEGVSYGHLWVAPSDTTVALIPVGYADGVPRTLTGRFDVTVRGVRRPSVGRVCMDQVMIDLGPGDTDVRDGDDAFLFGPGDAGEPHAQEWADALGTIHYEVVTGVRGRVERTHVGERG